MPQCTTGNPAMGGRVAGPTMLLLALLASYAILLRVQQYGWTRTGCGPPSLP